MLTGENGLLTQAQKAKNETEEARIEEENRISDYEDYISKYANGGYVESKGVNAPVLKDGMELVTFNEETKEWETNNSSSAYDYVSGENSEDNNKSKWANAVVTVDGVESYFVWIPRYAYKITYNNPDNKSEGGTIDVKFLIGTSDNYYDENRELKKAQRAVTGNEDTTSDYYVHPAFTNDVDLGGWRNELTGIWVGKYESSLVNKSNSSNIVTNDDTTGNILLSDEENMNKAIAIQPGMTSWRYCTIGNMYTNAKEYSKSLNSHMLKNSEWGVVAYLSWSQYGRNGHEININNSSKFITGSAGDSENVEEDIGTTNDYTSSKGILASSTGNVTGIYDLSGCSIEYIASYYGQSTSPALKNNGEQLINEINKEFVTEYTENKLGDATYETAGWNNDFANFENKLYAPFFWRGGSYVDNSNAGVFCYYNAAGGIANGTFRICLAIK